MMPVPALGINLQRRIVEHLSQELETGNQERRCEGGRIMLVCQGWMSLGVDMAFRELCLDLTPTSFHQSTALVGQLVDQGSFLQHIKSLEITVPEERIRSFHHEPDLQGLPVVVLSLAKILNTCSTLNSLTLRNPSELDIFWLVSPTSVPRMIHLQFEMSFCKQHNTSFGASLHTLKTALAARSEASFRTLLTKLASFSSLRHLDLLICSLPSSSLHSSPLPPPSIPLSLTYLHVASQEAGAPQFTDILYQYLVLLVDLAALREVIIEQSSTTLHLFHHLSTAPHLKELTFVIEGHDGFLDQLLR
jgi:hypothetical protein